MADAKSNYLENKILDHVLKNTAYTSPTTVYLALFTTDPTEANTGTEVTGGSYARQSIAFASASGGSSSNSGTVTFASLPAATIPYFGIYDASTSGNLLYYGALAAPLTLVAGSTVTFSAGNVVISEL